MQPGNRRTPAARLVFGGRFRGVRGSLPRLGAWWRLAPVLFFLIAGPVFAQGVSAPSNLAASAGDGEVTLTWDEPRDLATTGFEVRYARRGMDPPEAWNAWNDIDWKPKPESDTVTHTVEGLTNGFEYTFEVRAFAGDDRGEASRVRATPVPPPAPPDGLRASGSDGTVNLAWEDPMDLSITVYQIRYGDAPALLPDWNDGENIAEIGTGMTRHEVRNLRNWTEYTFEVRATRGSVEGMPARVTATPDLPPPRNLNASLVNGAVTLTWEAPATVAAPITGYQVLRRRPDVDAAGVSHPIGATGATETTYVDAGAEAGHSYVYRVKTQRDIYLSGSSNAARIDVPAPPPPPGNLTAREDDRAVTLTWDNSDAPAVARYEIRYGVGEAPAAWTVIPVSPVSDASTTTREVPGLTNGIEYTFEVRATRGSVEGMPARVTATPDLPPPRNLNASLVTGAVTLTWEAPATAAAPITGYRVLRRRPDVDAAGVSHPIGATGATETTYVDAGAEAGHSYVYRVKTQRDIYLSGSSNAARIDVPAPPPPAGQPHGEGG